MGGLPQPAAAKSLAAATKRAAVKRQADPAPEPTPPGGGYETMEAGGCAPAILVGPLP